VRPGAPPYPRCLNADEAPALPGAYAMAIELANTVAGDAEWPVVDNLAGRTLSLLRLR
jgi:hypothetical protein